VRDDRAVLVETESANTSSTVMVDQNLFAAAKRIDAVGSEARSADASTDGNGGPTSDFTPEPVTGVEPATSSLQDRPEPPDDGQGTLF
jgi:1,6-anhydro-N-acetylmuramate kinase